jgi:GT2 family glycosyltransferase
MEALRAHPDRPLCYTDEIWIRRGRRVNPKKKHRKYSGWIFERCLPLCIISPSSALIDRDLFETLGGFDEGLPLCEDYDLWLRITLRHPVVFIPEPLIVKRGGRPDQLSQSTWGLDRYRVRTLWKLLKEPYLKGPQRQAVVDELQRKCGILAGGARKRGKIRMARYYEELARISREEAIHGSEVGDGIGLRDRLEG